MVDQGVALLLTWPTGKNMHPVETASQDRSKGRKYKISKLLCRGVQPELIYGL